jgi:hypothetical protein
MKFHPHFASCPVPIRLAPVVAIVSLAVLVLRTGAQNLPEFDFTQESGAEGWIAAHDISKLEPTADGLVLTISGADPYFIGPARNYPTNQPLWMRLRIKSARAGTAQLFYFQTGPTEANSARFHVPGGNWTELRVPLPHCGRKPDYASIRPARTAPACWVE